MATPRKLDHVLYLDDEPDMRMLVQITLENMGGIRAALASSAVEALEYAVDHQPQMILLDVIMNIMDGPAILEEIKKDPRISEIPVVFLTAKTDPEDIKDLIQCGAVGVISKPIDLVALPDQIRALWEKACDQH